MSSYIPTPKWVTGLFIKVMEGVHPSHNTLHLSRTPHGDIATSTTARSQLHMKHLHITITQGTSNENKHYCRIGASVIHLTQPSRGQHPPLTSPRSSTRYSSDTQEPAHLQDIQDTRAQH